MEQANDSLPGSSAYIRYNDFYSIGLSVAGITMVLISLTIKERNLYYDSFLILAVLLLVHGIYALNRRNYIRLDKQNKTVKIFDTPIFWARKYKYDRLFFKDKKLYREIDGKTELIAIVRYQCRKDDFDAFIEEINKGV
jgi:hypothetical protein